jgi:hypothetical protein
MIKQLKFKIYRHECYDCGHTTCRDFVVEQPICVECKSTTPPIVTEEELIREIELYDTYTPEDYERAKKVAEDILAGVPLEEIDELELGDNIKDSRIPALFMRACLLSGGGAVLGEKAFTECSVVVLKDTNDKTIKSERGRYY